MLKESKECEIHLNFKLSLRSYTNYKKTCSIVIKNVINKKRRTSNNEWKDNETLEIKFIVYHLKEMVLQVNRIITVKSWLAIIINQKFTIIKQNKRLLLFFPVCNRMHVINLKFIKKK